MYDENDIREANAKLKQILGNEIVEADDEGYNTYLQDEEELEKEVDDQLIDFFQSENDIIIGAITKLEDWLTKVDPRSKDTAALGLTVAEITLLINNIINAASISSIIVSSMTLMHLTVRGVRLIGRHCGLSKLYEKKRIPGWVRKQANRAGETVKKIENKVREAVTNEMMNKLIKIFEVAVGVGAVTHPVVLTAAVTVELLSIVLYIKLIKPVFQWDMIWVIQVLI